MRLPFSSRWAKRFYGPLEVNIYVEQGIVAVAASIVATDLFYGEDYSLVSAAATITSSDLIELREYGLLDVLATILSTEEQGRYEYGLVLVAAAIIGNETQPISTDHSRATIVSTISSAEWLIPLVSCARQVVTG